MLLLLSTAIFSATRPYVLLPYCVPFDLLSQAGIYCTGKWDVLLAKGRMSREVTWVHTPLLYVMP